MKHTSFLALTIWAGLGAFGAVARAEPREPGPVTSDAVASCVEQHDSARLLRLEERWLEARAALDRCAETACPLAIRSDCSAWLEEIARTLPTMLVIVERDDGGKQPVELEIDGQKLALPSEARPIEVLPGRHTLRFSLPSYPVVDQTIELAKGEKNHVVRVRFVRERPAPSVATGPRAAPAPAPVPLPPPRHERPVPLVTWLAVGGSLAAFVTSGALLGSALVSKNAASDRCAPECHEGEREAVDARLLAADVAGAIGFLLGGVAVYTFVTRPVVTEPAALDGAPRGRRALSATLYLGGRF